MHGLHSRLPMPAIGIMTFLLVLAADEAMDPIWIGLIDADMPTSLGEVKNHSERRCRNEDVFCIFKQLNIEKAHGEGMGAGLTVVFKPDGRVA
ncbi:MAG: hypothetical protein ACR2RF_02290 [Geminicoccaceae bacterium]